MIQNKTIHLKLSHLLIGGILLLLLVFLVKYKPKPPLTNKYDKEKKEIERLKNHIKLLKVGQYALNKQLTAAYTQQDFDQSLAEIYSFNSDQLYDMGLKFKKGIK
jgi:hypothetical protein